jgi:hypothetical protein
MRTISFRSAWSAATSAVMILVRLAGGTLRCEFCSNSVLPHGSSSTIAEFPVIGGGFAPPAGAN